MACLKGASDLDDQSVCTVDDTFLNKDSSQTHLCHLLVETDSELRGQCGPLVSDRSSAAGNQTTTSLSAIGDRLDNTGTYFLFVSLHRRRRVYKS